MSNEVKVDNKTEENNIRRERSVYPRLSRMCIMLKLIFAMWQCM